MLLNTQNNRIYSYAKNIEKYNFEHDLNGLAQNKDLSFLRSKVECFSIRSKNKIQVIFSLENRDLIPIDLCDFMLFLSLKTESESFGLNENYLWCHVFSAKQEQYPMIYRHRPLTIQTDFISINPRKIGKLQSGITTHNQFVKVSLLFLGVFFRYLSEERRWIHLKDAVLNPDLVAYSK